LFIGNRRQSDHCNESSPFCSPDNVRRRTPAMTALFAGTIEGIVKNAQGQPLTRVQLT
jgi:hypothetical protein